MVLILLYITNNSSKHESFVYTQLKWSNSSISHKSFVFAVLLLNSSFWPMDRTLSGVTTLGQSRPRSNGNEGIFHIPQSFSITGASPSDCLKLYPGHLLEMQSIYSSAPVNWASYHYVKIISIRLVSFFNGISTKAILVDEQLWYYLTGEIRGLIPFPCNSMTGVGTHYKVRVQHARQHYRDYSSIIIDRNPWNQICIYPILQDVTLGQFFKQSLTGLNSEFSF